MSVIQIKTCTISAPVSGAAGRTSSVADKHCWIIIREDEPATFAATDATLSSDMFSLFIFDVTTTITVNSANVENTTVML